MRLHRKTAVIVHRRKLGQQLLNLAVTFTRYAADVFCPELPVFDMNVDNVGLHHRPAAFDIVCNLFPPNKIGRVVNQPQFRRIDCLYKVNTLLGGMTVNISLIFMNHSNVNVL